MDALLKVSEVAAAAGVLPSTIRYYANLGLLPPASTSRGGYRLFERAAVDRALEIRRLQKVERLTLDEIRDRLRG